MAGEVRVNFMFESTKSVRPVGWSEVLWFQSVGLDLLTVMPVAEELAQARANLLGSGYVIKAVRLSKEGIFRDSRLSQNAPFLPPSSFVSSAGDGDFACASLSVRMESDDLNRRFMWMSGIPDSVQKITNLPNDPLWLVFWAGWKQKLIAKWSYFGLQKQANGHPVVPHVKVLYPIATVMANEPSQRKRGRPFKLYRGRKTKKKVVAPTLLSIPAG